MATYNIGNTGVAVTAFPWQDSNKITMLTVTVDLSRRIGTNVPAAGYVTGDVLQLADIPASARVLYACYQVLVAEGAAATVSLGDAGSATKYASAVSINSAGNVTDGATLVNTYTAADVLKATLGGTLNGGGAAKFVVKLLLANVG